MPRLLRTRVLVLCGVALRAERLPGESPRQVVPRAVLTGPDTAPPASAGQRDLTLGSAR